MNFSAQLMSHIKGFKRQHLGFDLTNQTIVVRELIFTYHCCVASEQLLLDAAAASRKKHEFFCSDLARYYLDHYEEEKNEIDILAADLKMVGAEPLVPDNVAMGLIGSQYYMMKHFHPVSLLGYMAIQEADPVPMEVVELLEKTHGKELFRFIRLHAVKDIEHAKELLDVIDSAPENLRGLIGASADNALQFMEIRKRGGQ